MKILFVNGPAHGRVVSIPDDYYMYVIPVRQEWTFSSSTINDTLKTVEYHRHRVWAGYRQLEVMSAGTEYPTVHDILDAFVVQSGLS